MAYLRWNGSDWYVFAHASEGGLAVWTRFGPRPDLGDAAEDRGRTPVYQLNEVEDFVTGKRPMGQIPGWLQTSLGERERLLLAMHEYLVEERQPEVLEENLLRRILHREQTGPDLEAVWQAVTNAIDDLAPDQAREAVARRGPDPDRCEAHKEGVLCGRAKGHKGSHSYCRAPESGVLTGHRCKVLTLEGGRCGLKEGHGSKHLNEATMRKLAGRYAELRRNER